MSTAKKVSLFRNGANQAVRIPKEFELVGTQAWLRREGDNLVLEPIAKLSLLDTLQHLEPIDDDFPDVEDVPPEPVNL